MAHRHSHGPPGRSNIRSGHAVLLPVIRGLGIVNLEPHCSLSLLELLTCSWERPEAIPLWSMWSMWRVWSVWNPLWLSYYLFIYLSIYLSICAQFLRIKIILCIEPFLKSLCFKLTLKLPIDHITLLFWLSISEIKEASLWLKIIQVASPEQN